MDQKQATELAVEHMMTRYKRRVCRGSLRRQAIWMRMAIMKEVLACPEVIDDTGHCRCSWFVELLIERVLEEVSNEVGN